MLFPRDLAASVRECSATFPALLVTGPRQVGKSTLLETAAEPGRRVVTLDDPAARRLARDDPAFFFQTYRPPCSSTKSSTPPNSSPTSR